MPRVGKCSQCNKRLPGKHALTAQAVHTCTYCGLVLCPVCRAADDVHGMCTALAVAADVVKALPAKEEGHHMKRFGGKC